MACDMFVDAKFKGLSTGVMIISPKNLITLIRRNNHLLTIN